MMVMKMAKLYFLLVVLCIIVRSSYGEPNYQPQQPPGGNDFSGAGGGVNALYNGNQQQQQQQPRPYPPAPARFRPVAPATTPAPTFFQRISSWFSFLGDDSGERRPPQPHPQQQQQQQQQPYQQVAQLPPQQRLPPSGPAQFNAPGVVHPTPSVQTQQQLQYQQQQYQQQQLQFQQQQQQQFQQQKPVHVPQQQQPQQEPFPYPFQIRNGSRATQLTPVQVQTSPQLIVGQAGFQPSAPILESGSSYHGAAVPPHAPPFVPSTLQQQIVPPASAFRDPEPTTGRPPTGAGPGDVKYHPCNNVPWVPIAAPPEYPPVRNPGGTVGVAPPPKVAPSGPSPPIKLQLASKGQVQSVSPYGGPSAPGGGPEPAIITAAPHAQQLIQLQLQQQQSQLQNLQLQQLQLQQQQLQQELQQLKTTTTSGAPIVHTGAPPIAAHFITKASADIVGPSTTLQPITLRQVSASYFTNKEYVPPAKLLPIQDEGKPLAPIPLPNLSATPIPPLYTAGSFHSDPYKFYRPYRPVEPILELGHGYPVSSKSMSDSYTRYPHDPAKKNNSIFDVEQFASSASSSVYTTVAYSNGGEDSKPEASEKRNIATSSNGSSGANLRPSNNVASDDDTEYDSEEEPERSPPRTRTTVEVSSIVPQTRYYGSTTTSTMRPPSTVWYSTFQDQTTPRSPASSSSPPPPPPPPPSSTSDLGNGVQIIYSANLQTNSPINPVSNGLSDHDINHDDNDVEEPTAVTERQKVLSNTLGPPTIMASSSTTPGTMITETDPSPTGIYTEPFRIGSSLPAQFQRQSTPEPASQTVGELSTPSVTTVTPLPSSLTATFGGYQNLQQSTKKPKQIQIIIPYQTYKKPEPFRPLPDSVHLDDLDYNAPEESSIVTSKHSSTGRLAGPTPAKSANAIDHAEPSKHGTRFIENDSVKYFQSTAHLRDILQRETTQPFSKPPTKTPPKPAKVKKVRPVEISKESKPFTVRVPKMTPLPPVVSLSSLTSVRGGMERITTPLPTDLPSGARGPQSQSAEQFGPSRPAGPLIALSKYAKPVTPHYVNVTRIRVAPTTYAQKTRTTISQLLRTTKIIPKGPKLFGNDLRVPESTRRPPLSPASTTYAHHRRTTFLSSSSGGSSSTSTTSRQTTTSTTPTTITTTTTTTTTTTEQPVAEESTVEPIYERNDWDIDPNELQRKIDTWTEQEFGSDDFARKSSTLSLHRVTKAIPWEFLTSTMLPSLHDRPGKTGARSGWHNVKIAISPITKEKIYVVTPQPWTAALLNHHHHNHHHHHIDQDDTRILTPRFSVRPTPLYYKGGGIFQTGSSTVDVSPESVNDLLEQKPKHRFSSLGGGANLSGTSGTKGKQHLLQQRKYVRKKLPYVTGRPGSSREDDV